MRLPQLAGIVAGTAILLAACGAPESAKQSALPADIPPPLVDTEPVLPPAPVDEADSNTWPQQESGAATQTPNPLGNPAKDQKPLKFSKGTGSNPFKDKGREKSDRAIYLTFDDGPTPPYTNRILDLLAQYGAKATFFVVGVQAEQYPELIERILAEGHVVANHSWDHPNLTTLNKRKIRDQIRKTHKTVGPGIAPCLRPPGGFTNKKVESVANQLGYSITMWSTHVNDWQNPSVTHLRRGMEVATEHGVNLLLHDGGGNRSNTVAAVAQMLPYWQNKGYTVEALPQCR